MCLKSQNLMVAGSQNRLFYPIKSLQKQKLPNFTVSFHFPQPPGALDMIFIFTEYGKEQGKEKNVAGPYLTAG